MSIEGECAALLRDINEAEDNCILDILYATANVTRALLVRERLKSLAAKTNCRYPPNEPCEASGRCRVDGQRCSIRKSLANAISSTNTAQCADARFGSPTRFLCNPHPARRGTDAKGNMHDIRFADVLHSCSADVGARCFRTLVSVSNANP